MKKKIKSLVKRAIPFTVALFIFISSFCFSALGATYKNIPFNQYFSPLSFVKVNGVDSGALNITSNSFDLAYLSGFSTGLYIIELQVFVSGYYNSLLYNYLDIDFSLDDVDDYYFQGGDASSNFKIYRTLSDDTVQYASFAEYSAWGVEAHFDYSLEKVAVGSYTFVLPVWVRTSTDTIKFNVDRSVINALTDDEYSAGSIIDNQDKNTDKITNGWTPDTSVDQSTTDDFVTKEDEVHESIKPGLDDTAQIVGGLQDNIQDSGINIYNGVLALTQCMNTLMDDRYGLKPISIIVGVSLSLGIFAFMLGTVHLLSKIGSSHNNYNYKNKKGG